jgi:hypothetical protein
MYTFWPVEMKLTQVTHLSLLVVSSARTTCQRCRKSSTIFWTFAFSGGCDRPTISRQASPMLLIVLHEQDEYTIQLQLFIKITVFWDVTPCSLVQSRVSKGACCMDSQGVSSLLKRWSSRFSWNGIFRLHGFTSQKTINSIATANNSHPHKFLYMR